jgi:propanediol dehydratase small subunit
MKIKEMTEIEHTKILEILNSRRLDTQQKEDLFILYDKFVDTLYGQTCSSCATQIIFMVKRLYYKYKTDYALQPIYIKKFEN